MTDPDKPRENLLERWSRRKAEALRGKVDEALPATDAPPEQRGEPAAPTTALAFDISSLPSLESITSVTDIRAFLAPGVPQELARAALRRVWASDPSIRDFVGLQENDWDFTKPEGVPGFGLLPADIDIKKLLTQIFGEADEEPDGAPLPGSATRADELQTASASNESARRAVPPAPSAAADEHLPVQQLQDDQNVMLQRSNDPATLGQKPQGAPPVETAAPPMPRRHGSALPKV